MKSLFMVAFIACAGPIWAQCSLLKCEKWRQSEKDFSLPDRFGGLVFRAPEVKWRWQPQLRVERVTQENDFWLTDLSSRHQFPTLRFIEPRTEISSRILIFRERGGDSVAEVSLGFHRRPKGFGLVYRRSF